MKTTQQINVKWLPQCQLSHKNIDGKYFRYCGYTQSHILCFIFTTYKNVKTVFTYVSCEINNNGIMGYSFQCLAMNNAVISN